MPTVSVVLPTYRRPDMLRLCLAALLKQTLPPIEVCVGRRANDAESAVVLAEFQVLSPGIIKDVSIGSEDNFLASLNASLAATTGELVALTDDDAEAPIDWLQKLASAFSDRAIAGVGGRDDQPHEAWNELVVGERKWWGKVIGNHHLGHGPPRDVDVLKGVNCCFRGDVLRSIGFERALRGRGNVTHTEMHLCFRLRQDGYRLIYDPSIRVAHHVAPRKDGDINARGGFERESFIDGVHNGALAMLMYSSLVRRQIFRCWQFFIGTRSDPGLLQVVRLAIHGVPLGRALERFFATREGCAEAERTYSATTGPATFGSVRREVRNSNPTVSASEPGR
ncbi:MAG: glycosyltransferase family 2 protein [Lacipirellulaceae bacterium]